MSDHAAFDDLAKTVATLRAPGGCPWDREQTHESIAKNMIEEAYEALDAIESGGSRHLCEELGDVLLQVMLHSQIAEEAGEFTIDDVCTGINEKLLRRHPHVFGQESARTSDEVKKLWESVKKHERTTLEDAGEGVGEGLLDGIPKGFPSLLQAQKISKKVVSVGFEWETVDEIWQQVFEEIDELQEAYAEAAKDKLGRVIDEKHTQEEVGDVLFSMVNVARRMGVDAETSLRVGCDKFRSRWKFIENTAWSKGRVVEDLTVDEMEDLWQEAKIHE